jgi:hypothetical protein
MDLFEGIDTSIKGIAKVAGLPSGLIDSELEQMQSAAAKALASYQPLTPQSSIPILAEGLRATRAARSKVASANQPGRLDADFLLTQKENEFSEALQRASEVTVDALSNRETASPGESILVSTRIFIPEGSPVKVTGVELKTPESWEVKTATEPKEEGGPFARFFREIPQATAFHQVTVPQSAQPTQPYWLSSARQRDQFNWSDPATMNLPFAPPLLSSEATLEIGGVPVKVKREVQYRYADDIRGEIRRQFNVVPAVSLGFDSDLVVVPASGTAQTRRVAVRVSNNANAAVSGTIKLDLPDGLRSSPASVPFSFTKKDEHTATIFNITIPAGTPSAAYKIGAKAMAGDKVFDQQMHVIAYPHIMTHRIYTAADATVRVLDLKVANVKIGYIMGSGDQVPEAIKQMGLDITMLDEKELSSGDLSKYDTIVVGVRASEVRQDFVANNERIMDFVKNGGTLIVQYQRPDYVSLGLEPYPAQMASRVTDENARVSVLTPQHPAFTAPNRISDADWQNWVQERSLYNFTTFDSHYEPLLESHDPGEGPQRGGEVYAKIGRGQYVYTSYSWFRQLPAGVPGAYRLFANLLSLPKTGDSNANIVQGK